MGEDAIIESGATRAMSQDRHFVILLVLLAGCASGQTSSDPGISLFGYSEDATVIRFALRNNRNVPVTYYEVRLQAQCPDGTVAQAGGWSFDTLRTRAGQPNLSEFAPLQIETIELGDTHQFEFNRPIVMSTSTVSGQVAETRPCQPSTLKDFTVIFLDGTAIGAHEVIEQQFVRWQTERDELKQWLDLIHDLRTAQDAVVAMKSLRDKLDQGYDDCEDRVLTPQRTIQCQMNREIRQTVNRLWHRLRSSPENGVDTTARLVSYWDLAADLLEKQSLPRN